MKSKYSYSYSVTNPKISPVIRNTSKNLLIRKNGITFLLMKVYIIVPDDLKNLISFKNNFYIYYPIKNNDFLQNKNIKINNKFNNHKICLTKKDIIDEVKFFIGINKNSKEYDFDIYNKNLGILKTDFRLKKVESIVNNIIYIKVKLRKEHSEIKLYNDNSKMPKIITYKNNISKFIDYINKSKKNNNKINLKKIIKDSFDTIKQINNYEFKKNMQYYSRNTSSEAYKNNNYFFIKSNIHKIDRDKTSDDFAQTINDNKGRKKNKYKFITLDSNKNSFINDNNINTFSKNRPETNMGQKNLSTLNYFPKEKTDKYKLKLFNKYQTIRTLKWKEAFLNKQNLDNISIRKGAYSYADRQKFMKRLYENKRNKKKIHLLQPSIIKSYMEMYSYDINDNEIQSKKKS
jgi:hypothetical protein